MKSVLFFAALGMVVLGCGKSPLFNHLDAKVSEGPESAAVSPGTGTRPKCNVDFPKAGLCGVFTWDKALSEEGDNPFTLTLYSATGGAPQEPTLKPFVQLWMPTMGHGSSPVTLTKTGTGIFRGLKVFFIMPGKWDVRVQLKDGNTVREQAILKVTI